MSVVWLEGRDTKGEKEMMTDQLEKHKAPASHITPSITAALVMPHIMPWLILNHSKKLNNTKIDILENRLTATNTGLKKISKNISCLILILSLFRILPPSIYLLPGSPFTYSYLGINFSTKTFEFHWNVQSWLRNFARLLQGLFSVGNFWLWNWRNIILELDKYHFGIGRI